MAPRRRSSNPPTHFRCLGSQVIQSPDTSLGVATQPLSVFEYITRAVHTRHSGVVARLPKSSAADTIYATSAVLAHFISILASKLLQSRVMDAFDHSLLYTPLPGLVSLQ